MVPATAHSTAAPVKRFDSVETILISGQSNSGKTTFSKALLSHIGNAVLIETDALFMHRSILDRAESTFVNQEGLINIARYVTSKTFDIDQYLKIFIPAVVESVANTPIESPVLVIEGYVLDILGDRITTELRKVGFEHFVRIRLNRSGGQHKADVGGVVFNTTNCANSAAFRKVDSLLKSSEIAHLRKRSNYQSFDMLGHRAGSSDSRGKFTRSRLEQFVNSSSTVLDIGCNLGYFCFRCAKLTDATVVGIDLSADAIRFAKRINHTLFKCSNVSFLQADAFSFENERRFDVVLCFSVFHYFRERQDRFLKQVKNDLLAAGGSFILEIELSSRRGTMVEKISRKVDDRPCFFPTRTYAERLLSEHFTIVDCYPSVRQRGSRYDRHFFLLRDQ